MITLWFLLYLANTPSIGHDPEIMQLGVYATEAECKAILKRATSKGLYCVGQDRLDMHKVTTKDFTLRDYI